MFETHPFRLATESRRHPSSQRVNSYSLSFFSSANWHSTGERQCKASWLETDHKADDRSFKCVNLEPKPCCKKDASILNISADSTCKFAASHPWGIAYSRPAPSSAHLSRTLRSGSSNFVSTGALMICNNKCRGCTKISHVKIDAVLTYFFLRSSLTTQHAIHGPS